LVSSNSRFVDKFKARFGLDAAARNTGDFGKLVIGTLCPKHA
jgi:hypothetical protein